MSKAIRLEAEERKKFGAGFSRYVHDLDRFNRTYPNQRIPFGPFTADARTLVKEILGEVFRRLRSGQQHPVAAGAS